MKTHQVRELAAGDHGRHPLGVGGSRDQGHVQGDAEPVLQLLPVRFSSRSLIRRSERSASLTVAAGAGRLGDRLEGLRVAVLGVGHALDRRGKEALVGRRAGARPGRAAERPSTSGAAAAPAATFSASRRDKRDVGPALALHLRTSSRRTAGLARPPAAARRYAATRRDRSRWSPDLARPGLAADVGPRPAPPPFPCGRMTGRRVTAGSGQGCPGRDGQGTRPPYGIARVPNPAAIARLASGPTRPPRRNGQLGPAAVGGVEPDDLAGVGRRRQPGGHQVFDVDDVAAHQGLGGGPRRRAGWRRRWRRAPRSPGRARRRSRASPSARRSRDRPASP